MLVRIYCCCCKYTKNVKKNKKNNIKKNGIFRKTSNFAFKIILSWIKRLLLSEKYC